MLVVPNVFLCSEECSIHFHIKSAQYMFCAGDEVQIHGKKCNILSRQKTSKSRHVLHLSTPDNASNLVINAEEVCALRYGYTYVLSQF